MEFNDYTRIHQLFILRNAKEKSIRFTHRNCNVCKCYNI